jgi:hypothetical protein
MKAGQGASTSWWGIVSITRPGLPDDAAAKSFEMKRDSFKLAGPTSISMIFTPLKRWCSAT